MKRFLSSIYKSGQPYNVAEITKKVVHFFIRPIITRYTILAGNYSPYK